MYSFFWGGTVQNQTAETPLAMSGRVAKFLSIDARKPTSWCNTKVTRNNNYIYLSIPARCMYILYVHHL